MAFMSTQGAPSSSYQSSTLRRKFEVFLSFYGEDTRFNFTDYLYKALTAKELTSLETEKSFSVEKIFLKGFRMQYRKEMQLTIFPVFYHVDPSDVGNQTGSFADAFDEHRKSPKTDEAKRNRWIDALKEVSKIAGYHVEKKYDTTVIEEISDWVLGKLTHNLPNVSKNLVGMESRVKEVMTLLRKGEAGVRFIGFHGMGGIGKTTLAEAIFHRVSSEFDASCFIACDEETRKRDLVNLQKQLIVKTLMESKLNIWNVDEGTRLIAARFRKVKVLIVIDNVDQKVQLESLVGKRAWFGEENRIIITSRDLGLLRRHFNDDLYLYEVKWLNTEEALEVFSWQAFGEQFLTQIM